MAMAEEAFAHSFATGMKLQEDVDPHLMIRSASAPPVEATIGSDLPRVLSHGPSMMQRHLDRNESSDVYSPTPDIPTTSKDHQNHQQHQQYNYLQQQQQQQQQQHAQSIHLYSYPSPGMQPMQPGFFDVTNSPYMGPMSTTMFSQQIVSSPGIGPYTPNLLPQSLLGTPPFGHQQTAQDPSAGGAYVYSPAMGPSSAYFMNAGGSVHQMHGQVNNNEHWMYASQSPNMVPMQAAPPPPMQLHFSPLPPAAMGSHQSSPTDSARYLRSESSQSLTGNTSRSMTGGKGTGIGLKSTSPVWGGEATSSTSSKPSSLLEELKMSSKGQSSNGNNNRGMHVQTQSSYNNFGANNHGYNQTSPQYYSNTPQSGGGRGRHTPAGGGRNKSPANGVMWGLRAILGQVCEFAKDQHGSRFIQQQLESPSVSDADKQALFEEVLPVAHVLALDVFGNYVIQKLLAEGQPGQQEKLVALALEGHMLDLSKHMYACRVVQKLIEKVFSCRNADLEPGQPGSTLYNPEYQDSLLRELEGSIIECVQDQNGNHVIQKCIEQVRPISRIAFILDSFKGNMVSMAMHPYGCRVAQRVMENCDEDRVRAALGELIGKIDVLIVDQFANYVCQHIIERRHQTKESKERKLVLKAVRENVLAYSTHKFASNVVERCIQFGQAFERREIIEKMLERSSAERRGSCPLVLMMKDPYANYVVQKVIDTAEPDQQRRVVQLVRDNAAALKKLTYGKHILARLDKIEKKG